MNNVFLFFICCGIASSVAAQDTIDFPLYLLPFIAFHCVAIVALYKRNSLATNRSYLSWFPYIFSYLLFFTSTLWSTWQYNTWWMAVVIGSIPLLAITKNIHLIDDKNWDIVEHTLVGVAMYLAIWATIEYDITRTRTSVTFKDSNVLASYFNFILIFLCSKWSLSEKYKTRIYLFIPAIFFLSFSLFSTFSRAAIYILLGFLLVLVLISYISRIAGATQRTIVVISVIAASYFFVNNMPGGSFSRDMSLSNELDSSGPRVLIWSSTIDIFLDNPIVGTGLGSFRINYPKYRSFDEIISSGNFAHSDYLQFLSDGGILLFIPFILYIIFVLFSGITSTLNLITPKLPTTFSEPNKNAAASPYLYALISYTIHATVNHIYFAPIIALSSGLFFYRILAFKNHGEKFPATREKQAQDSKKPILRLAAIIFCIHLALFEITNAISSFYLIPARNKSLIYSIDSHYYTAAFIISRTNPTNYPSLQYSMISSANAAINNSDNLLGVMAREFALDESKRLNNSMKFNCSNSYYSAQLQWIFLKKNHDFETNQEKVIKYLESEITASPNCTILWHTLALLYNDKGDHEMAVVTVYRALPYLRWGYSDFDERIDLLAKGAVIAYENQMYSDSVYLAQQVLHNNPTHQEAKRIIYYINHNLI